MEGKWHCPRLEVYCLMRNVVLALWFYNCKVCVWGGGCMCVCKVSVGGRGEI